MSPGLAVYIHNCPIQEWVVDHLVSLLAPRVFQEHATEYPTTLCYKMQSPMDRYVKDQIVDLEVLEERVETYMEAAGDA